MSTAGLAQEVAECKHAVLGQDRVHVLRDLGPTLQGLLVCRGWLAANIAAGAAATAARAGSATGASASAGADHRRRSLRGHGRLCTSACRRCCRRRLRFCSGLLCLLALHEQRVEDGQQPRGVLRRRQKQLRREELKHQIDKMLSRQILHWPILGESRVVFPITFSPICSLEDLLPLVLRPLLGEEFAALWYSAEQICEYRQNSLRAHSLYLLDVHQWGTSTLQALEEMRGRKCERRRSNLWSSAQQEQKVAQDTISRLRVQCEVEEQARHGRDRNLLAEVQ
mmetsp:Transcript_164069/g.526142  ORF Transcript_164069/g.526142 Transcript_164069/m.526142 type:complete len:282 (-) Transcript_164069:733-1578(-)